MEIEKYIWIFVGDGSKIPTGVFSSREKAIEWIQQNELAGYLGEFPVDVGVYDWAMTLDYYKKRPHLKFDRQDFTTALLDHEHFTETDYEQMDDS